MVEMSKGEEIMAEILAKRNFKNIIVIPQYDLRQLGCTRRFSVDFMLCNKWSQPLCAIEVNGKQHYNDTKVMERDRAKAEFLHNNCIGLVSIPWDNYYGLDFNYAFGRNSYSWQIAEEEEWSYLLHDLDEIAAEKIEISLDERKKNREEAIKEYYKYFII